MLPIKIDGINRPRGISFNRNLIAHLTQLFSDFGRDLLIQVEFTGETLVKIKRITHLVAGNVGCFAGLLNRHPELDHIEEKLKQVLVLGIPALDGKRQIGFPSFIASPGVRVALGLFPGAITLNGFSASSRTKLWARWLRPMPVFPATTAGIQAPLGVRETTQPASSAAWIEVVPCLMLTSSLASSSGLA